MSYIEESARNTLTTAFSDLTKGRRALLLAAGILALIHLLTVYPYLDVSQEMAIAEAQIAADEILASDLEPLIARLSAAESTLGKRIDGLLERTTQRMIDQFTQLGALIKEVRTSDQPVNDILAQHRIDARGFPGQIQQQQQQIQWMGPSPPQMQMPVREPETDTAAAEKGLNELLEAIDNHAPNAQRYFVQYAREAIVGATYSDAQKEWIERIRPPYLAALHGLRQTALELAARVPASASKEAEALRTAAQVLARARASVEALEIRADSQIDDTLRTDWWRTVEGKGQYADAVRRGIKRQTSDITTTSQVALAAIRQLRDQQQTLRSRLIEQREALEAQFAAQGKQLAALTGAGGILPIDLSTFIGVFPLVLGIVLALTLLRIAQARADGARAMQELAAAAPDDRETRRWMARRILGAGGQAGAMALTILLAAGFWGWIAFAALQLGTGSIIPPVPLPTASGIGIALVAVATAWDLLAIRSLAGAGRG